MLKRIKRLSFLLVATVLGGHSRAKLYKATNKFGAIGDGCYLGTSNFGTEPFLIEMGDNVVIATGVRFINHDMSAEMISNLLHGVYERASLYGKIKIGNNVFIGAGAIILPGVSIGNNVVVGAGSVITKDLESGWVYAGLGKKIKEFDIYKEQVLEECQRQRALLWPLQLEDNGWCMRRVDE